MWALDSFFLPFSLVFGIGGGLVLLVQFLSLRIRNTALPPDERDPHLGRKFALGLFLHLAVLLLLVGLTVFAVDFFEELINGGGNNSPAAAPAGPGPLAMTTSGPVAKPFPNAQQRVAFGLMLSGVLHGVLFAMLLFFSTNARKFPAVSRAFVLNRLLVAGVILMLVTTEFCLLLFSEGGESVESPFGHILGMAVVWGPVAIGNLLWLFFGLNQEKAKATRMAEVGRPPEGTRYRRRDDD